MPKQTKGFAITALALILGAVAVIGVSIAFGATFFGKPRQIKTPLLQSPSPTTGDKSKGPLTNSADFSTPASSEAASATTASPSQTTSPGTAGPSLYSQPQGVYKLSLPALWTTNSTFATSTYSTTKFAGPEGNISITFGTGKDPAGGCSETSAIVLADRTISGCFLLQKDGSRLLNRSYTKDKADLPITIEAYINSPTSVNQQPILEVIKTIDIR